MRATLTRLASLSLLTLLAACGGRLSQVNQPPALSAVSNPALVAEYQPVAVPHAEPVPEVRGPNALWESGSRSFFKNQRAARIGDILTVKVRVDDQASFDNRSSSKRKSARSAGISNIGGLETSVARVMPNAFDPSKLVGIDSETDRNGSGTVNRSETLNTLVAATVVQVLPNGHLVIQGRQEVRVNYERRDLVIAGIVRPEDVESDNTIDSTKIAEARISYGGNGELTSVVKPRLADKVLEAIVRWCRSRLGTARRARVLCRVSSRTAQPIRDRSRRSAKAIPALRLAAAGMTA